MKMVKSLLLGSAAGVVAMAGAQAADLPVKAKPVQYVKICSLYGAGFYYIPGTDMCLKMGGWVRQQTDWNANGSLTNGALVDNVNTRGTANYVWRSRGYLTADARNQTEYGTVRSYIAVGLSGDNAIAFSSNRAFIQFAGFTFGLSQSFFDFYSGPATSYFGGKIVPSEDTGDGGQEVWGYTAQFGGGLSGTIAAENRRDVGVWNTNTTGLGSTGLPASSQRALQWPDIVANLRVDQKWGSAQIMGAVHDASGTYYSTTTGSGHPSDVTGFAIGAGIKLLAPMVAPGDYFQAEVNYAEGASGYINAGGNARYAFFNGGAGGSYGTGVITDGVYGVIAGVGTSVQLTTAWGVNAAYEHFWSKSWRTSVYGAYQEFDYNSTATTLLCPAGGSPFGSGVSCNPDFQYWAVGSRTQWNVSPDFYMGVDVVYTQLNTASGGLVASVAGAGAQPTAIRTFDDQSAWTIQFRVHKDFYP